MSKLEQDKMSKEARKTWPPPWTPPCARLRKPKAKGAAERARRAMTEALKAREAEAACSKHGEDK